MNYYYNDAYDFALFEEKKTAPVVDIPQNEKAKRNVQQKQSNSHKKAAVHPALGFKKIATIASVSALVLLLFFFQIDGNVKATETTDQISKTEKQIEQMKSEQIRLQMELDGKVSYENIEKAAEEAGMQKPTAMQMRYINIYDTDTAEITGETNIVEKFLALF